MHNAVIKVHVWLGSWYRKIYYKYI